MADLRAFSSASNIVRFRLTNSSTGAGVTSLTSSSSGLIISTICDNEATATAYTQAGGTIQTIATLGTFAAPSASNCRFKEIDSTNHPGLYEFQFADARFAVTSAKRLIVTVPAVSGLSLAQSDYEVQLTKVDVYDAVHGGMTAIPNTACTTNASLLTSGTGTDQISVSAGKILLQATQSGVTIPTVTTVTNQLTAATIATGIWQDTTAGDFTTASSIGKSLYTSGVVPGGAGGLFIAGTNAATTITTGLTTTFTGNLTGSVGSVTGAVGSVTGRVTANSDQLAGQTVTAAAGVTFPTSVASPTNITAGTITTVTNLTNAPTVGDLTSTMKTSVTTAATAATPTVAGITGVTFPTNFGVLSISSTTGLVDILQSAADKVWGTTTRRLSDGTNIVLAKGVGLTGLNDIAATAIVSSGAITTNAGAVTTATNLTNAATSGDFTSTMKTSIGTAVVASVPTAAANAAATRDVNNTSPASNSLGAAVNVAATGGGLSGPSSVTLTFNDADGNPVAGVDFTVVGQGSARANGSGQSSFGIANGTYSIISRTTLGVIFPNASLVVSGATTLTITGAAAAITPPADPTLSAGFITTRDGSGTIQAAVSIVFWVAAADSGSYDTTKFTATSDGSGLLQTNFVQGLKYYGQRGSGPLVVFLVPSMSVFELPVLLGTA